jgi:hypothetical protein
VVGVVAGEHKHAPVEQWRDGPWLVSNFLYHLIMAGKILRIPKGLPGDLVECGCFKGGSAVNLSRLAALTGRRLHLFDSFEGLPAPQAGDKEHLVLSELQFHTYEGGAYAGSVKEVQQNIRKYGVAAGLLPVHG